MIPPAPIWRLADLRAEGSSRCVILLDQDGALLLRHVLDPFRYRDTARVTNRQSMKIVVIIHHDWRARRQFDKCIQSHGHLTIDILFVVSRDGLECPIHHETAGS